MKCSFFVGVPYQIKKIFFYSCFFKGFIRNVCCTLLNAFPASIQMIILITFFFLFIWLMWWLHGLFFKYWTKLAFLGKSSFGHNFYSFYMLCFAALKMTFVSMHMKEIGCCFFLFVMPLSGFGSRITLTSKSELGSVLFSVFWKTLCNVGICSFVNI